VKTWTHLPEKLLSKNKGTRSARAREVPIKVSSTFNVEQLKVLFWGLFLPENLQF